VAALVVGFFAIFHGHADGSDVPTGANGLLYSMGLVVAKGTWHAAGIGMGLIYQWPLGRVSLRAAGAVVALAGATFLWRAIAPRGTL
jgi:urease accessory protein